MDDSKGHFRKYADINISDKSAKLIGQANVIIEEYEAKGYSLTLRQLYYQFVARGLMENDQRNYSRLSRVLSDGRIAGLVSWTAIEDRTRNLMGLRTYVSPQAALKRAMDGFRLDLWSGQRFRPEVWVEKEALAGVVQGICNRLRVDFFACRGYNSQSEQWAAGQRFASYVQKGQIPIVFHLGDHDPSGIDMTRDNRERLAMFSGFNVTVQRLALNWEQIEELNPPPNPAKSTDSRFEDYERQFGSESWELDALPPEYIENLISKAVGSVRDEAVWDEMLQQEVFDLERMQNAIDSLGMDQ